MKFTRQQPPVEYRDYRKYRQYTRRDFRCVCAHCFRHEEEAGGEEHYVQDHFEPKHRPNVDPADYFNLYWSCGGCNSPRNKGAKWPTLDEEARGERFCDPCQYDPVGTDYVETENGKLEALTGVGTYTIRHIRLCERSSLIKLRLRRRAVRHGYVQRVAALRRALDRWTSLLGQRPDDRAHAVCIRLAGLIDAYESFVSRDPFMLSSPFPPEIPDDLIAGIEHTTHLG